MKNSVKITVVTVTYNAEQVVERTIQSVVSQTYKDLEYIIVDGQSHDRTIEIVKKYMNEINCIKVISEKDTGIYNAMNKGIALSTGMYTIFMNAGDYFVNGDVVSRIVSEIEKSGFVDNIYGNALFVYDSGIKKKKDKLNLNMLMNANTICHQVLFSKTELLKKFPYNEKYRICADREWIYKMYKAGNTYKYVDVDICYFDTDGFSMQDKNQTLFLKERFEIQKKYFPICFLLKRFMRKVKQIVDIV